MKRLTRSKQKIISGVCGGFADYFAIDAVFVRAIFVIVTMFTGVLPGVLCYIILALIIPEPGKKSVVEAEIIDDTK